MGRLRKRRVWALAAVVAAPLLVLALEGVLRASGFGYPGKFYRVTQHEGRAVVREDPGFVRRFFPPALTRYPSAFRLAVDKPRRGYRLFLFGGSVAEGDPEPSFSITRTLGVLLREAFPDIEFELVNAGITATNSHVALPVARDCAELEPDLFVVFLGHNEVVGPFGPATVFSPYTQSRRMIRASIALRGTKVGQLLESMIGGANSSSRTPQEWGGIGMFADQEVSRDDPRLENTYRFFEQNLLDMYRAGNAAGAHVILLTAPSNLRDFPPFRSRHGEQVDPAGFDAEVAEADRSLAAGDLEAAVEAYERALALDDEYAEAHFRLGWLYLQQQRLEAAHEHLSRARDLDRLRFRADSRINAVIRDLGRRELTGLEVVDAMALLGAGSPGGVPGNDVFYEQVHLKFRGIHALAVELFRSVHADLVRRGLIDGSSPPAPLGVRAAADRLALTLWEQYKIERGMLERFSQPPFTEQSIQEGRLRDYRERARKAREVIADEGARESIRASYERALEDSPGDWIIERNLGRMLIDWGDLPAARLRLESAASAMPGEKETLFSLCKLYQAAGELEQAEQAYTHLREIVPLFPEIDYHLGEIRLARGDARTARAYLERNLTRYPGSRKTRLALAEAYGLLGNERRAIEVLEQALERFPASAAVHHALGKLHLDGDRIDVALPRLERAVELDPQNAAYRADLQAARSARP